jgi:hypothetical protein
LYDALHKPQKARLDVGREGGDLRGNSFVEDLDSPTHNPIYLRFGYWPEAAN